MSFWELLLIAVGLSMDAFAASVCKGLSAGKTKLKHYLITGLYFGGFQALMPLIGYILGKQFEQYIVQIDHWIAFILLSLIGINMIREARSCDDEEESCTDTFSPRAMLPLAIATSIDALAIGITFAFLGVDIYMSIGLIGGITFTLSAVGVGLGSVFGAKYRSAAELCGGVVLILIGTKILLEHLGIIAF